MRYFRFSLLVLTLVAAGLVACRRPTEHKAEDEPLLLLDDGVDATEADEADGPVADNSRCYVCHINFDGEKLTVMHARADVGCEDCHGASDAHCSDEDNITPPEIMYPAAKINSLCNGCHPDGKLSGGMDYCTDCHGEHRLSHRTRRWDRETGELIEDDKVRMLGDTPQ